MVAGSDQPSDVQILQNGKVVKNLTIKDETLYRLIEGEAYGEHILEIRISKPGLKAFTFTFG